MNEIQRMLPHHQKILDLTLAGYRLKDIAQAVDMTTAGVSLILNSPIFQDELARRRAVRNEHTDTQASLQLTKARDLLEENVVKAAQVHVDLLTCDDPKVRQTSADRILERVMGKSEDHQTVVVLQKIDVENLQIALSECAA